MTKDNNSVQIQITPQEAKDLFSIEFYLKKEGLLKPNHYFKVLKRSIDARSRQVKINLTIAFSNQPFLELHFTPHVFQEVKNKSTVTIIGAGPAGLFAALEALILGFKPLIIEQGKTVKARRRDLVKLTREGIVNETSNYCFGEGGAGTYSDGKLYTRSNKRGSIQKILELLVQHGASSDILVENHPHIGTNKLPKIIENIRETILAHGGEFFFETQLIDFTTKEKKIVLIVLNHLDTQTESLQPVNNLILCTGHSGRDIFYLLNRKKIKIEAKSFAIGVRIEHSQALIDSIQYHCKENEVAEIRDYLPAAAYNVVTQANERGVYSFCMCPGGVIAPCATKNGEIVTNGWSPSKRNNPFANSGIVVETKEEDWIEFKEFGELRAMKFQSSVEQTLYSKEYPQFAPAQRLIDFLENKKSTTLPESSYKPGIYSAEIHKLLPKFVVKSLQQGFLDFGKKMRNYLTNDAVLVAIESRTSSPVRIPREQDTLNHLEILNLYPCGEGAGYAGGIVSAAIDGQRCMQAILANKILIS